MSGSGVRKLYGLSHWPPCRTWKCRWFGVPAASPVCPTPPMTCAGRDVLAHLQVVRAAAGEVRVVVEAPVVALDADDVAAEPVREALDDRAPGDGVDGRALGAKMSMPSCLRPPERAAPNVSVSLAPWMGRTSASDPAVPNPENAGAGAVAVAAGYAIAPGYGATASREDISTTRFARPRALRVSKCPLR